jgi:hypothetical protein
MRRFTPRALNVMSPIIRIDNNSLLIIRHVFSARKLPLAPMVVVEPLLQSLAAYIRVNIGVHVQSDQEEVSTIELTPEPLLEATNTKLAAIFLHPGFLPQMIMNHVRLSNVESVDTTVHAPAVENLFKLVVDLDALLDELLRLLVQLISFQMVG